MRSRGPWGGAVRLLWEGPLRLPCLGESRLEAMSLEAAWSSTRLVHATAVALWTFIRLNAVAARWSSAVVLSRPRREKRSRIFFRLRDAGFDRRASTLVEILALGGAEPVGVHLPWVAPSGGAPCAGSSAAARAWSRVLPIAISRSGPSTSGWRRCCSRRRPARCR